MSAPDTNLDGEKAITYSKVILSKIKTLTAEHNKVCDRKLTVSNLQEAFLNSSTIGEGMRNVSSLLRARRGDYFSATTSITELNGNFEISFSSNPEKIELEMRVFPPVISLL